MANIAGCERCGTKDFVEFIECCVARDVRFLIVSGHALAAHGYPRATKDLDVSVMIDPDNAELQVGSVEAAFISQADGTPRSGRTVRIIRHLGDRSTVPSA